MPYASFNRFEIELSIDDAESGSHQGSCDEDIAELRKTDRIKKELDRLSPDNVRDELREYGAWDEKELQDHDANLDRILWIACGDIVEESRR